MNWLDLETPALVIDRDIMLENLRRMQAFADRNHVRLRPHTKTHKMPWLARLQMELGSGGITVAKTGEAEVMAAHGLDDIFIANEIVGRTKLERIAKLAGEIAISFGADSVEGIETIESVFSHAGRKAEVLIEIEVGENRSGIIGEADFVTLLGAIRKAPHVHFRGIFSHDGHSYKAKDLEDCRRIFIDSQKLTLRFADLAAAEGLPCEVVSVGSTPSLANEFDILPGITEIRPGTYIFMDASQGAAVGTLRHCAATVLATVISRPTPERTILDVGAKGLTMQERSVGICANPGKGTLIDFPGVHIASMYDEHALVLDRSFRDSVRIGQKVRIVPVHICPVVNLYETAYLVSGSQVVEEIPVACRGKLT